MTAEILIPVLGQCEHIDELISQSAAELSSVSIRLRHELANTDPPPAVTTALEANERVTSKLQDASERLTAVKQALQRAIRDRILADHQLAAAVEQEQGSRNAAWHDHLTGLPNRLLFNDRLEHGIAQAKRHHWILAVMFVDLDNFKGINDSHGHQAGDTVLQAVASRLRHNTRNDDTVSRYGGDEFLCLLTQLHEQKDIAMIAAKILNAIRAPCEVGTREVIVIPRLEASIGISLFPRDGDSASALIQSADAAMYRAKENHSGYVFAS